MLTLFCISASRLSHKNKTPDLMTTSCYSGRDEFDNSSIMSQSFDPSMLTQNVMSKSATEFTNNCASTDRYGINNDFIY